MRMTQTITKRYTSDSGRVKLTEISEKDKTYYSIGIDGEEVSYISPRFLRELREILSAVEIPKY